MTAAITGTRLRARLAAIGCVSLGLRRILAVGDTDSVRNRRNRVGSAGRLCKPHAPCDDAQRHCSPVAGATLVG
jgi:hypothetical protein